MTMERMLNDLISYIDNDGAGPLLMSKFVSIYNDHFQEYRHCLAPNMSEGSHGYRKANNDTLDRGSVLNCLHWQRRLSHYMLTPSEICFGSMSLSSFQLQNGVPQRSLLEIYFEGFAIISSVTNNLFAHHTYGAELTDLMIVIPDCPKPRKNTTSVVGLSIAYRFKPGVNHHILYYDDEENFLEATLAACS